MKIRKLLTDKSQWTQGANARNSSAEPVGLDSADAVCWCLAGALVRCYRNGRRGSALERDMDRHVRQITHGAYGNFVAWNDAPERTFNDIRQLIEEMDI